jgi:hypothetical protein
MSVLPEALSDPWPAGAPGGAEALVAQISECLTTGVARHVLLLHLARLPATQAQPAHLRLARAALAPLARLSRATLFHLADETLVVMWRGDGAAALQRTMQSLSALLVEDSPTVASVADLAELAALPQDGPALLLKLRPEEPAPRRPAPAGALAGLDAAMLLRLERRLAGTSVARFVRRRQVWDLSGAAPVLRWEKRTLSVSELAEALEPGLLPEANPWLFRRLTRTLDGRMLALLASIQELAETRPFSLALNAASILGPAFLRFDGVLPARLRGEVVLELLAADMLADPALFLFARNFARARRYQLLLRGLSPALLGMVAWERVEMDFLRLDWGTELVAEAAALTAFEPGRVVLCGADEDAALEWGAEVGISLYQGLAADRLGAAGA